jgi:hypothetical protein
MGRFDFRVEFKPGASNVVADALSRRETEAPAAAFAISTPTFTLFDNLRVEYTTNPALAKLRLEVMRGDRGTDWAVVDDLVTYHGSIYISASSPSLQNALTTSHGMGHEGAQKTLHHLHANFIPGARTNVHNFVRACATYLRNKTDHLNPAGLLRPLEVPPGVWADIAMDFIEGFPKVSGKSVILTMVGRFSKYTHFIPLSHPYMATTMACAFFTDIVRLHGLPSSIVSDRNPAFMSNF